MPDFDGDAIFARLLDADRGGSFQIHPRGSFQSRHWYLDETNILVVEHTTAAGTLRIHDFMPALTAAQKRRTPVPDRAIFRRIAGISGQIELQLDLRVRPRYGRKTPHIRQLWEGCYVIDWGGQALHLISSMPLEIVNGTLRATRVLNAGERIDLALAYSLEAPADLPVLSSLDHLEALTADYWHTWAARCRYQGPYRAAVVRSALTLKLLIYAPSGAIIAAPTAALPEEIGGVRNWDYRYCWLRDATFTIRALLNLGYRAEAHAFAGWLLHTTRLTHPRVQVFYTIYGESRIPQQAHADLEGYRGSRPVHIGNAASSQFQLDVYGEMLNALKHYRQAGGTLDREARGLISGMARVILREWREPDAGIWEARINDQYVHSKIMAWVGLNCVLEIAQMEKLDITLDEVRRGRDAIRDWVFTQGFDRQRNSFTRVPGRNLDAALLALAQVGPLAPDDPHFIGTVDVIQRGLAHGELVYRYDGDDGLPGQEGTFVACAFWLVEALARIGRTREAHAHFERLLERCNALGLLAEEMDPHTGEHLGNFPQGLSHIALINAALILAEAETQGSTIEVPNLQKR